MPANPARVRLAVLPIVTLLLGLSAAWIACHISSANFEHTQRLRFDVLSERVVSRIQDQMDNYGHGLRGVRGLFVASESVEPHEFERYISSCDLSHEYPGARGFGYIHRVPRTQLADYLARIRANVNRQFEVRSDGGLDHLYVVQYLEPLNQNEMSIGFDAAADPTIRIAADHAMLTGEPVITGRLMLDHPADAHGKRAGVFYLLPFYDPKAPAETPEQRRAALIGWIYAPLLIDQMMADVFPASDDLIDFDIYDGNEIAVARILFDADGHKAGSDGRLEAEEYADRTFSKQATMTIGDRSWTIWLSTRPRFDQSATATMVWVSVVGGVTISFLVAGIVALQGWAEIRAHRLARQMTAPQPPGEKTQAA